MATKKKKPSGSQAEQVKKWAHADEMSFLDNFIRERPEQSSSLSTKSGTQACEIPIDDDETVQLISATTLLCELRNQRSVRWRRNWWKSWISRNFDSCSRRGQYAEPIGERRK
uniref:Uncharacterized protein n=1 Tax=Ditylenchus dipsaci TaxID=166011 RepID=A0A915EDQ7_9BILA